MHLFLDSRQRVVQGPMNFVDTRNLLHLDRRIGVTM
jgi:hypothetical protein